MDQFWVTYNLTLCQTLFSSITVKHENNLELIHHIQNGEIMTSHIACLLQLKTMLWLLLPLTVTTLGSRCPVLTPRPLSLLAALFLLLWAGLWLCCTCSLPGLLALMSPPAGPAPTATGPAHSPPCCSGPQPPGRTTVAGVGLPPRNCNRHRNINVSRKFQNLLVAFFFLLYSSAELIRSTQQSFHINSMKLGDSFWYGMVQFYSSLC